MSSTITAIIAGLVQPLARCLLQTYRCFLVVSVPLGILCQPQKSTRAVSCTVPPITIGLIQNSANPASLAFSPSADVSK